MLKILFFILFNLGLIDVIYACPNCAGSSNGRDIYTVYILAIFIALIYIPFWILFRLAYKFKKTP